ncbi:DUF1289 domain-containing protein [Vreelandella venusta]|uniref:DUF1289 domain-containing protein n=1 Tax=Vreelandella venusta TaxID=44935 RepID=A0AAP9ZBF7_9GAMM|nr:DUF1289 domain-containing protein [Halomonas venusta]AZM96859.1 DUF1289 domain-containing protein [Halomonas venusta]NPT32266.1 DUF1289 domain-containing protein [Halomonas venusta]QRL02326.1 DUF1289 domain-containing protein [Halomonas venusta]WAM47664.1 DUF1289 domain-containing protein [Halomonas venusta]WAM51157.1 DUF1289 domain-containing protein [Halomonas venusta]
MSSDSSPTRCVPRPLSPCIQVCNIDPASSLCQGCGRTLDEIACWGSMTEAEKTPVWERLEQTGYVDTLRQEEH